MSVTRLIDISPVVSAQIAVWPGDRKFTYTTSARIADGDNIDLGAIETTLHAGAHADAPSHYVGGGASIDQRDLGLYYGPCEVVEVPVVGGARLRSADLPGPVRARRVLFKTGTFPDPNQFNQDFAALSAELVDALAAAGVRLIGVDTPSVDLFADKVLEAHQALARNDMANLEGLVLEDVAPGLYTLIALPLRIAGADASPVRAALVSDTSATD